MKKIKPIDYPLNGQLLDTIKASFNSSIDFTQYPFCLDVVQNLKEIKFTTPVTFFVGENGTGKSTILEAIAYHAGFGIEGGSKNINFKTASEKHYSSAEQLADCLTLSWNRKPEDGYFFRAETFYNVANHLDHIALFGGGGDKTYAPYGGKSLHEQSHGESFLSFFKNRLGKGGFFVLDEPEAALSPQRQLSLMVIINQLCKQSSAQFIIATHSPLLLAYPGAVIYSCDNGKLDIKSYKDTDHYQITKSFLDNPDYFLHHLFND